MSCIILASYQTLSQTLSHDDTMLLLQHALCENLHSWMQYIVKGFLNKLFVILF
jgi:hypothetical protein